MRIGLELDRCLDQGMDYLGLNDLNILFPIRTTLTFISMVNGDLGKCKHCLK